MPNIPLTLLVHIGFLSIAVVLPRLCGHQTALRPLLLGLGVLVLYWTVSPLGFWVQSGVPGLAAPHWNWLGKVFAIVGALAYWRLTDLPREEIGMTWRQRSASMLPASVRDNVVRGSRSTLCK